MDLLTDSELDAIYDALYEQMDKDRHYPDDEHSGTSPAFAKVSAELDRRRKANGLR
jgi:hypothetical protein